MFPLAAETNYHKPGRVKQENSLAASSSTSVSLGRNQGAGRAVLAPDALARIHFVPLPDSRGSWHSSSCSHIARWTLCLFGPIAATSTVYTTSPLPLS